MIGAGALAAALLVAALLLLPLAPEAPALAVDRRAIGRRLRRGAAGARARGALPGLLQATGAALRSGLPLPEALRRAAAGCPDPLGARPFADAVARFDVGDPLDRALAAAAAATTDRRVAEALRTLALGIGERLPIERAAALVDALAERAAHDAALDRDLRARTAGVRLQLLVLAAVVPGLAAYLVVTLPGLAAVLGGPLGRTILLPGAVLLELAGVVLGRRIVGAVLR